MAGNRFVLSALATSALHRHRAVTGGAIATMVAVRPDWHFALLVIVTYLLAQIANARALGHIRHADQRDYFRHNFCQPRRTTE